MAPSVGVIIPTYQGARHLQHCLPPLLQSPLKPKVLIIDSSSTDQTVDFARSQGVEVVIIPQKSFNHGTTREWGRKHLNTSIVVMITQDAYITSSSTLENLIQPIIDNQASVSYGRQLPHLQAGFFGSFAREFNYSGTSHIRSIQDIDHYGVYTFFCSNSCAAYLNSALDEVGGFPHVLFGEDTVAVAKLLHQNHSIAYVAEATVFHSHDYSLSEEFSRHFDIGLARHSYQDLIKAGGKDSQRGTAYVKTLLKTLLKKAPWKIPYGILQIAAKYCGYRLGQASLNAPQWFKKRLSSQKYYWEP
jgi:rhamnosyltransferase